MNVIIAPATPLLATALCVIVAWIVVLVRAGSSYAFMTRAWTAITKHRFKDPVVNQLGEDISDLEAFRFIYGIRAKRKTDMHRCVAFAAETSLEISRIAGAGRYIDFAQPDVLLDCGWRALLRRLWLPLASFLALHALMAIIPTTEALLTMRSSKTWFLTDARVVRSAWSEWSFSGDTCNDVEGEAKVAAITGFTQSESTYLCNALATGAVQPTVASTTQYQRGLVAALGVLMLMSAIVVAMRSSEVGNARGLKRRITMAQIPTTAIGAQEPTVQSRGLAETPSELGTSGLRNEPPRSTKLGGSSVVPMHVQDGTTD